MQLGEGVGSPVDPGLQDLYDTGQQHDVQEESRGGSSVGDAAFSKGLEANQ